MLRNYRGMLLTKSLHNKVQCLNKVQRIASLNVGHDEAANLNLRQMLSRISDDWKNCDNYDIDGSANDEPLIPALERLARRSMRRPQFKVRIYAPLTYHLCLPAELHF